MTELQNFWQRLWTSKEHPFQQAATHRDLDPDEDVDVPEEFTGLHGLPKFFRAGGMLIRDEYKEAEEYIQSYQATHNSTIVVGHPGIGKTHLWSCDRVFIREPIHQGKPFSCIISWSNALSLDSRLFSKMRATPFFCSMRTGSRRNLRTLRYHTFIL